MRDIVLSKFILYGAEQTNRHRRKEQNTARNDVIHGEKGKKAHEKQEGARDKEGPRVPLCEDPSELGAGARTGDLAADQLFGRGRRAFEEVEDLISADRFSAEREEQPFGFGRKFVDQERKGDLPIAADQFRYGRVAW